jgi:hypothetical protein
MADLLAKSSAWLEGMRTTHLSRTITYRRGVLSLTVAASVGRTVFELDDGNGAVIRTESRDYLILTGSLILGGVQVLPERGDLIDDGAIQCEVMVPGAEDCWRYSDPHRQSLRVHTKALN